MKHLVDQADLSDEVTVDSAGTIGHHTGNAADQRMQQAALSRGYDLQSRSRKIVDRDLEKFDLIIAMDRENLSDILRIDPPQTASNPATVKLLSSYLGDDWPSDVPDPYYGGAEGFEYVLDMIEAACPKILEELVSQ